MDMQVWLRQMKSAGPKRALPILSFPSTTLLGVTVKELVWDSHLQAKGMKMTADAVPSAAAVSMMDLSVEAEAFGAQIRYSDSEVPTVTGALIVDPEDAERLDIPQVGAGRTGLCLKAAQEAAQMITDRPVFAGTIGPFSLAGRLMDVSEALVNCCVEPEMVHTTMDKTTEFLVAYLSAYRQTGAHGIVMAEPLAGLLSAALTEEFVEPYVKKIVETVQTEDFLIMYHNCGGMTLQSIQSILRCGASGYHFGNAISMAEMLEKVPEDTLIMGNLDPAGVFRNGTPETVRQETIKLMEACCRYPNFVVSSGCDIPPATPWENIHAFFGAVDEFYARSGL